MTKKCKTYDPKIKARLALEVLSGGSILEICTKNNILKTNLREWRDKLVNEASNLFIPISEQNKVNKALQKEIEDLEKLIGQITIENNFYKKKISEMEINERKNMFEILNNISIRKQVELLMIPRSFIYYKPLICDDTELINLIKEIYLESNCLYGYRKIEAVFKNKDYNINHKRILRIMNESGICGHYPRKKVNTSRWDKNHKIYPYKR